MVVVSKDMCEMYECPRYITHITSKKLYEATTEEKPYTHPSLEAEGFIHSSLAEQVLGTANRYPFFTKVKADLPVGDEFVLLVIDTEEIPKETKLVVEYGGPLSGQYFPHIFGPIPKKAIKACAPFMGDVVEDKHVYGKELPAEVTELVEKLGKDDDKNDNALLIISGATEDIAAAEFHESPSLAEEGFIHCSTAGTISAVLNLFFASHTSDVKLAVIDRTKIRAESEVKFEEPAPVAGVSAGPLTGHSFPHIYGKLNTNAIVAQVPFKAAVEQHRIFKELPKEILAFYE